MCISVGGHYSQQLMYEVRSKSKTYSSRFVIEIAEMKNGD
jgi:hypothetical protein